MTNLSTNWRHFVDAPGGRTTVMVGVCIVFMVALSIADALALQSLTAMEFAGRIMRFVAPAAVIAAVLWRGAELGARWIVGDEGRLAGLADRWLESYWAPLIVAMVSITVYQLPVLASQVGILSYESMAARLGAVAGVIPLADSKQYYGGAIGVLADGTIGQIAVQRPLHALDLSTLFLLTDFSRMTVLLFQAALAGLFTGLFGLAIARKFGPGVALPAWAICFAFAVGTLPSFMSETSGIWMGHAALLVLAVGAASRSPQLLGLGAGALMLAFSARAGVIFLVPALFVAGVVFFYGEWTQLRRFLLVGVLATVTALLIPQIAPRLYDARGGGYQANLGFIIYEFAVDGEDWDQVRRDFPELRKVTRGEMNDLIWEKAIAKSKENPGTFVRSYFKRLFRGASEIPAVSLGVASRPITEHSKAVEAYVKNNRVPFFLIYYGGLAWLVFYGLETWRQRAIAAILIAGYFASLPFVWFTGTHRMQAATWMLLTMPMAGLLARRVVGYIVPGPERQALSLALARGLFVWALVISLLPFAYQQLFFPFKRGPHTIPTLNEGERVGYLVLGPHVPFLRLREGDATTRMIRPDISIAEFAGIHRINRDRLFEPYAVGEQLMVAFDLGNHTHRIFWSDDFCMPDRPWVYRAVLVPQSPPHVYRIKSVVPVQHDGKPLPKGVEPPYECQ